MAGPARTALQFIGRTARSIAGGILWSMVLLHVGVAAVVAVMLMPFLEDQRNERGREEAGTWDRPWVVEAEYPAATCPEVLDVEARRQLAEDASSVLVSVAMECVGHDGALVSFAAARAFQFPEPEGFSVFPRVRFSPASVQGLTFVLEASEANSAPGE